VIFSGKGSNRLADRPDRDNLVMPYKNVIEELREFDNGVLKYQSLEQSATAVSEFFRSMNPRTDEEYDNFYRLCDDYVYENAYWNNGRSCIRKANIMYAIFKEYGINTILEVGSGCGTDALFLNMCGFDVSVMRADNKAFRFFERRMDKYGKVKVVDSAVKSDCVILFDVIEHVTHPYLFMEWISKYADSILMTQSFGVHDEKRGGMPQHFDTKFSRVNNYIIDLGYRKEKLKYAIPPHFYIKERK